MTTQAKPIPVGRINPHVAPLSDGRPALEITPVVDDFESVASAEDFAFFDDPRNIVVGRARIIWAMEAKTMDGTLLIEGWVLPGGRRTTDRVEATLAADYINRVFN